MLLYNIRNSFFAPENYSASKDESMMKPAEQAKIY